MADSQDEVASSISALRQKIDELTPDANPADLKILAETLGELAKIENQQKMRRRMR